MQYSLLLVFYTYHSDVNPIYNHIYLLKMFKYDPEFILATSWIGNFSLNQEPLFDISLDRPYNVLVIMLESVPAERVGFYGYERNVTPNIDTLFSKSIVFNRSSSLSSHSDYSQPGMFSARHILIVTRIEIVPNSFLIVGADPCICPSI